MTLVIYGVKCGISKQEIEKDAIQLIPFLNGLNDSEPFTKDDIKSALECYDERYNTFPLSDIEKLTDIRIQRNKRNGRKQEQHLQLARGIRQLKESMGEVVSGGGRPDKAKIVQEWRKNNPKGKKADCIRDTGLTKPTVYKWWDETKEVKRADREDIPKGHWVPQNIIRTRSDSDTVSVTIQLPKSTIDQINNMTLKELETFMEVQEDDNILGYAYFRTIILRNNKNK